jgi:hypothetical protein
MNAYHERFKTFLHRFRGVATKYFNHYVAYHRFMDETSALSGLSRAKQRQYIILMGLSLLTFEM